MCLNLSCCENKGLRASKKIQETILVKLFKVIPIILFYKHTKNYIYNQNSGTSGACS